MNALDIYYEASTKGKKASVDCTPKPMNVIGYGNVSEGLCGFAWITIPCVGEGRKFINALKKLGIASANINDHKVTVTLHKNQYKGGYTYWVNIYSQSVERKEAFAKAFAEVLRSHNIACQVGSRLD